MQPPFFLLLGLSPFELYGTYLMGIALKATNSFNLHKVVK